MIGSPRLRRLAPYGAALVLALALTACAQNYPNTTFTPHSDLGRAIDGIWNRLLFFGTLVFVLVESVLLFVVFKYRRRDETVVPPQTHGHTTLEILWTLIPAAILVFIAVPTVRTIFKTQQKAPAGALQVEVYGHQWWWEFKYPEYNITTANEVYIPTGRAVNFILRTKDVLHSFWMPQLAGKRDLIANHTNYIWFTPDTNTPVTVWNGFCTEYCGSSHAFMRFRVVTVRPDQFASWVQHQQSPAVFNAAPAPVPAAATPVQLASYTIPANEVPSYAIPHLPVPTTVTFDDRLVGDAARGQALFTGAGTCNACHSINGNPLAVGNIGPNLTHFGSRIALGAGMYPNRREYLVRWIKNARVMKPGNIMPTLGKGETDPRTNIKTPGGLTEQQIADVAAYLQALK